MSVAFTREEIAEKAAEVELPDRPISPHPNLVTASGLDALTKARGAVALPTTPRGGSRTPRSAAALSHSPLET